MTISATSVANMALGHLGVTAVIANVDTDTTGEAKAVRLFYDTARDKALGDFVWPWATKVSAVALVNDYTSDNTTEWSYGYRYPNDALRLVRVRSGYGRWYDANPVIQAGGMTSTGMVRHRIITDGSGLLLHMDLVDPVTIEYVSRITDASVYPADFVIAFSFLLAALIAPRLTGGDPNKLGIDALKKYALAIGEAKQNAVQQEGPDEWPMSGFESARI